MSTPDRDTPDEPVRTEWSVIAAALLLIGIALAGALLSGCRTQGLSDVEISIDYHIEDIETAPGAPDATVSHALPRNPLVRDAGGALAQVDRAPAVFMPILFLGNEQMAGKTKTINPAATVTARDNVVPVDSGGGSIWSKIKGWFTPGSAPVAPAAPTVEVDDQSDPAAADDDHTDDMTEDDTTEADTPSATSPDAAGGVAAPPAATSGEGWVPEED